MYNQNHRICLSVLGSAYFKGEIAYYSKLHGRNGCYYQKITFQTEDAKREAARSGEYCEWMIYCRAQVISTKAEAHFYISRAYHSNRMFVYRYDLRRSEVYLENLSTHVSILDTGRGNKLPTPPAEFEEF